MMGSLSPSCILPLGVLDDSEAETQRQLWDWPFGSSAYLPWSPRITQFSELALGKPAVYDH